MIKKRILSFVLAFAMIIGMVPVSVLLPITAMAEGHTHDSVTFTEIKNLDELEQLFKNGGSGYLAADITLKKNELLQVTENVNLCLNDRVLNLDQGSIKVTEGKNFNLYDCGNGTTRYYVKNADTGIWTLATDQTTATDYTTNGGVITGGYFMSGGGVCVVGGSFTMNGGSITGNTAMLYGGGVYVDGGTFTMNGGNIDGNTATQNGGGVYVNGGASFIMTGGSISGNTASGTDSNGGGVYVNGGANFTMTGGEISDNTASKYGGGVFNIGTTTLNGGTISGNKATSYGGGVYVDSGCSVTVGGAVVIRGNKAGSPEIESNIHLNDSSKELLKASTDTPLISGADIGVTVWQASNWAPGTEVGSYLGDTMTDSNYKYFFMTNSGEANKGIVYGIVKNSSDYVLANSFTVTGYTEDHGKVNPEKQNYTMDETVTLTVEPVEGYQLTAGSLTVAKTGDSTSTVEVTEQPDGTYQFTMPAYPVTVTAEFKEAGSGSHKFSLIGAYLAVQAFRVIGKTVNKVQADIAGGAFTVQKALTNVVTSVQEVINEDITAFNYVKDWILSVFFK